MDEELIRAVRRWQVADERGDDDEADAALRSVFPNAVAPVRPAHAFVARTMEAVAQAAAVDARRARRTRVGLVWGAVVGGGVALYASAGLLVSLVTAAMTRALDLLVGAIVGVASGAQAGADVWTLLASLGRAAAAFAADPGVTLVILAFQGIAVAALIALQRLLGSDGESYR